jgi:Tol biopolymer transport system component
MCLSSILRQTRLTLSHLTEAAYGRPWWLPESNRFFFLSNQDAEFSRVSLHDLSTKETQCILEFSWDVETLSVTKDGQLLLVIINEDGYSKAALYDTRTLKPISAINLPAGVISQSTWSNDCGCLAFSRETEITNVDVWIWSKSTNASNKS